MRLVEDFEIGVRMVAVFLDKLCPHAPPVIHVLGARRLRRAPIAHHEAPALESHIQGARIHVESPEDRRLVHRDANAVRSKQFLELPDNAFRHHGRRLVIVRKAHARKYQHVRDEVVALVGPVDATELTRNRKGIRNECKRQNQSNFCFHKNILIYCHQSKNKKKKKK